MKKFRLFLIFFVTLASIALMFSCKNKNEEPSLEPSSFVGSWKYSKVTTDNEVLNNFIPMIPGDFLAIGNDVVIELKEDKTFKVIHPAEQPVSGTYEIDGQNMIVSIDGKKATFQVQQDSKDQMTISSRVEDLSNGGIVDKSQIDDLIAQFGSTLNLMNININKIQVSLALVRKN